MKGNLKLFMKIFLILTVLIGVISVTSNVFAFDWGAASTAVDSAGGVTSVDTAATNVTGAILNVCKVVAVGIALIMIVIIAAKYMLASAGDRADIKKHAVAYITGAVILFASAGLVQVMQSFAEATIPSSVG